MAACRSTTEWKAPFFRRRRVSLAKKPSTALSHEHDVGTKWKVRAWLDRHPRWTFHFVVDLQAAINRFIKEHNQQPRPFVWRANPDEIIAAVRRGYQTLESVH